jgi:predicted PurR-regulated permease PerM
MPTREPDLARITFQLLGLGALIVSVLWILRPFLVPMTWATMIVVASWPLLLRAQAWLGGRRSLAVTAMTLVLLLVLVVPLGFATVAIAAHAKEIVDWSQWLATLPLPQPPGWIEAHLPGLATRWRGLAATGREEVAGLVLPYTRAVVLWFVAQVGGVARLLLEFLLTVVVAAILYARGEAAARGVIRFAWRLAGPRGENAVRLAGQAIRAVALGVVVTAMIQAAAVGLGLALVGVPFAAVLGLVTFILSVAQIGAGLVLIPAVVWVYVTSGPVWGTGLLVWGILCMTFDNFLRPFLIKHGADLPLLLIFAGVIGGLIAFGVVGLFIGPVVLAVAHTLLAAWVSVDQPPDEREAASARKA